jgi:hypothetical protein
VTANPGNISATGSSSPITVPVLTNSTAYTFTVTATNADGFTGPVATASTILNGLSVTLNGSGSGSVNSSPSGINITAGTSSNIFNSGSTVSLFQSASNGSQFSGWGGACTGTGGCNVLLTSLYQSVTATFDTLPSVRILGSSKLYELLQLTYDGATTGDVIQSKGMTFIENLTMDKSVSVTFKGGYDSTFSTQNSYTVLEGVLRVKQGRLVVNHLIIK